MMREVSVKNQVHYYSPHNPVALEAESGDSVLFHCLDTYNNLLPDTSSRTGREMAGTALNPLNGPVYVKGAMPGDTMKITVEEVRATSPAATMVVNDALVLKGFRQYVCEEEIIKIPLQDGRADIFGNQINLCPFPGCLGLSPREKISTMYPGRFGGNMDCKVLTRGSVIYIPVQVPGGLVTAGDIHAYQGDGEIVCGLETAGEILLKLEVVKGVEESWPIIETADRWYTVASRETMEEASHSAVQAMMDFIRMRTKRYSNYEIMILLSQFADIQVCQIVDPLVTMRFGVERRVIEEVEFAQPAKEP